jgi:hypothetical protein
VVRATINRHLVKYFGLFIKQISCLLFLHTERENVTKYCCMKVTLFYGQCPLGKDSDETFSVLIPTPLLVKE